MNQSFRNDDWPALTNRRRALDSEEIASLAQKNTRDGGKPQNLDLSTAKTDRIWLHFEAVEVISVHFEASTASKPISFGYISRL